MRISFRLIGMFLKVIGNYFDPVTISADRSSLELMVRFAVLAAFTLIRRRIFSLRVASLNHASALDEVIVVAHDENVSGPSGSRESAPGDSPRTG